MPEISVDYVTGNAFRETIIEGGLRNALPVVPSMPSSKYQNLRRRGRERQYPLLPTIDKAHHRKQKDRETESHIRKGDTVKL